MLLWIKNAFTSPRCKQEHLVQTFTKIQNDWLKTKLNSSSLAGVPFKALLCGLVLSSWAWLSALNFDLFYKSRLLKSDYKVRDASHNPTFKIMWQVKTVEKVIIWTQKSSFFPRLLCFVLFWMLFSFHTTCVMTLF